MNYASYFNYLLILNSLLPKTCQMMLNSRPTPDKDVMKFAKTIIRNPTVLKYITYFNDINFFFQVRSKCVCLGSTMNSSLWKTSNSTMSFVRQRMKSVSLLPEFAIKIWDKL